MRIATGSIVLAAVILVVMLVPFGAREHSTATFDVPEDIANAPLDEPPAPAQPRVRTERTTTEEHSAVTSIVLRIHAPADDPAFDLTAVRVRVAASLGALFQDDIRERHPDEDGRLPWRTFADAKTPPLPVPAWILAVGPSDTFARIEPDHPAWRAVLEGERNGDPIVEVHLQRERSVLVHVRNTLGHTISNAEVWLHPPMGTTVRATLGDDTSEMLAGSHAITDEAGRAIVRRRFEGPAKLRVSTHGYGVAESTFVNTDQTPDEVEVVLKAIVCVAFERTRYANGFLSGGLSIGSWAPELETTGLRETRGEELSQYAPRSMTNLSRRMETELDLSPCQWLFRIEESPQWYPVSEALWLYSTLSKRELQVTWRRLLDFTSDDVVRLGEVSEVACVTVEVEFRTANGDASAPSAGDFILRALDEPSFEYRASDPIPDERPGLPGRQVFTLRVHPGRYEVHPIPSNLTGRRFAPLPFLAEAHDDPVRVVVQLDDRAAFHQIIEVVTTDGTPLHPWTCTYVSLDGKGIASTGSGSSAHKGDLFIRPSRKGYSFVVRAFGFEPHSWKVESAMAGEERHEVCVLQRKRE